MNISGLKEHKELINRIFGDIESNIPKLEERKIEIEKELGKASSQYDPEELKKMIPLKSELELIENSIKNAKVEFQRLLSKHDDEINNSHNTIVRMVRGELDLKIPEKQSVINELQAKINNIKREQNLIINEYRDIVSSELTSYTEDYVKPLSVGGRGDKMKGPKLIGLV